MAPTAGVHGPGRHYSRFQRNRACQGWICSRYPSPTVPRRWAPHIPDPFMSPRRNAYDLMTHYSIVNRDGPHARGLSFTRFHSHGSTTGKKRTGAAAHTACLPCCASSRRFHPFWIFLPAVTTRATYTCKRAERGDTIDSQACVLLPGLSRTDADLT